MPFFFSPGGGWLVTKAENSELYLLYELTDDLSSSDLSNYQPVSFAGDRWLILRANENGEETVLYDLEKRDIFQETYPPTELLEVSPDGKWLYGFVEGGSRTEALLIDLNKPENFFPLTGHTDELIGMDFTPDGRSLLTYGYDRTIRIWDLENPADDPVVLLHEEAVEGVDFTENGKWLLSHTPQGIYLWQWNIEDVHTLACRLVGRNLTQEEWRKYIGDTDRDLTCDQWP